MSINSNVVNDNENSENEKDSDFILDFTTSSAISRVNPKFLAVYIPILWFGGFLSAIFFYAYIAEVDDVLHWIIAILCLPLALFGMWMFFILGCLLISKFMLILVNLIHKPKEGIFLAEIGDTDFEFWCLRIELKKIVVSLIRNCPLPWIDALAFRWFGIKMDFSSHLQDAWVDVEFIEFSRKGLVGQGAVVMSSMVVGKYLIIKKVIIDDYVVVGGHSTVAPGTIFGKESILGACNWTTFNKVLEPGWIYFGFPARKIKANKYAEKRRDVIIKTDVVIGEKIEVEQEINIDDDKRELV